MESIIRNVRDIEGDDRRALEGLVGQKLSENQQIIIQVLTVGEEPSEETRARALDEVLRIARRGRDNAAAQGVSAEEADAAVDEAVEHVRSRNKG